MDNIGMSHWRVLLLKLVLVGSSAAAGSVRDACTATPAPSVYYADACYTQELQVKTADEHAATSCLPMNGLRGHLAYPTSSALMQSWLPFATAYPTTVHYVGVKKITDVVTAEDNWYFVDGGEKVHTGPLVATRGGDPPKLLPWANTAVHGSQPDWSGTEPSCGALAGSDFGSPALWDNLCTSGASYAVCEYSEPDNARSNVKMVRHAQGLQFKAAAVTKTVAGVRHQLQCLVKCVAAGSACRCATYAPTEGLCSMSAFPCDRGDIFESAADDVAVYRRKAL